MADRHPIVGRRLELFGSSAEGFREVIRTYAKGSGEAATFVNQPFLKDLQQFIITDLGSHMLDVVRLLFGEATSLYCQTQRIHKDIKGEDVATIVLKSGDATDVLCQMAYAGNYLERERFSETFIRPSLQITGLTQSVFAGKLMILLAYSIVVKVRYNLDVHALPLGGVNCHQFDKGRCSYRFLWRIN